MPRKKPVAHENALLFQIEHRVGGVEGLLHGMACALLADQGGKRGHAQASKTTMESAPQPTLTELPTGATERPAVLRMEMVTGSFWPGRATV